MQILYRRDKWMSAPMQAVLSHLSSIRLTDTAPKHYAQPAPHSSMKITA